MMIAATPLDRTFVEVYGVLRRYAHRELAKHAQHTLDTTSLVHEAYLKLVAAHSPASEDRARFLRLAGKAMRQIVVDYARRRGAGKRGGQAQRVTLNDDGVAVEWDDGALIALEHALLDLEQLDARLAEVIELRFFAGLSSAETAVALGVTERTVVRDWRKARAYLFAAVSDNAPP